ncbi:RHS repeat-associated core domain-containing protein, partial [Fretibacterium sp. OH1220_COT-178]|uniref:RHS repeat-associated core domain-containing protein n=1 Tax=Fretibacterium sp. OH1220_COT-178 TaxID=2491047 RepID=UPI000FB76D8A
MTRVTDALGNRTEFTYNDRSQLAQVKDPRGNVTAYDYDANGNRTKAVLANESAQVTDTWTYDAWGETTSRTGVTENDYQYAGERFDRTTELYQLRARYMDPRTGTFLSLDPHQGNR